MAAPGLQRARSLRRATRPWLVGSLLFVSCVAAVAISVVPADEGPFLAENDAAMERMMAAMSIKPSGNIDRDFAAMMIPHHQGAIDMAQAELRYGSNEQLRRLAQEIVVSQQQEIAVMRLAVTHPMPAPSSGSDQLPFGE
jgi:hypothetical protein